MSSNFIEAAIRSEVDSGELLAMLPGGESLGGWEKDGVLCLYWSEEKWTDEVLDDLKKALTMLGVVEGDFDISVRTVPDQDWNATWAASLQPIQLGQRIRIRQSWHERDEAFDGIELIIDPKRAFGTGYHATTQMVVEWLQDNIRGGERILDIGTGSGILAMAAIRLGADSALGIDNDPVAVECAREYAATNGFGSELELRVAALEDLASDRFDVIVANIDGRTLPLLCGKLPLFLNEGGKVCLSGLQAQDQDEISDALNRAGLQINSRMESEEWLALQASAQ